MPDYVKQTWADNPEGNTPIDAARLNHMEEGIDQALPRDEAAATFVTQDDAQVFLTRNTAEPIFVSHEEADALFLSKDEGVTQSTVEAAMPTFLRRRAGDLVRVEDDSYVLVGTSVASVRDRFNAEDGTALGLHQPETFSTNGIGWEMYGGGFANIVANKVRLFDGTRTGIAINVGAGPQALGVDIITGSTTKQRPTFEVNRGNGGVYRFSTTATSLVLERTDTQIATVPMSLFEQLAITRRVEVEWDGVDTLRFIVDGTEVLAYTDPTPLPATGNGVVVTGLGGTATEAGRNYFDNFDAIASGTFAWERVYTPPLSDADDVGNKTTISATDLPITSGRTKGDGHLLESLNEFYVLTGEPAATSQSEDFNKADGSIVGKQTTTGSKTWVNGASGEVGFAEDLKIVSGHGENGYAYFDCGLTGYREIVVDATMASAASEFGTTVVFLGMDVGDYSAATRALRVILSKQGIEILDKDSTSLGSYMYPEALPPGDTALYAVTYDGRAGFGALTVSRNGEVLLPGGYANPTNYGPNTFVGVGTNEADDAATPVAAINQFNVSGPNTLAWTPTAPVPVLTSPGGTEYRLVVDDAGVLGTEPA